MPEQISKSELKELLAEIQNENDDAEISLSDIVLTLHKYRKGATILGLILFLISLLFFVVVIEPEYESQADFLIPLKPDEDSMSLPQEIHISMLQSEAFTQSSQSILDAELAKRIATIYPQKKIEHLLSFNNEDSILSIRTRRNSDMVSLKTKCKEPVLCAEIANALSEHYLDWAGKKKSERVNQKLQAMEQRLLKCNADLDTAETDLKAYLDKSGIENQELRVFEFLSSFTRNRTKSAPSVIIDPIYQSLSEHVYSQTIILRQLTSSKSLLESVLTTGTLIQMIRNAEVPEEASNVDLKRTAIISMFAFFLGFVGWVIFRIAQTWFRQIQKQALK